MKIVLILSGGLDSTVLAYAYAKQTELYCLSFDYGQKHRAELGFAKLTAEELGLNHKVIKLDFMKKLGLKSALLNQDIPTVKYDNPSQSATIVPNRNMIMLSIAIAYAKSIGADEVMFGANADDRTIYPDCREEFIAALNLASKLSNEIRVVAPLLFCTKKEIVQLANSLHVPIERTWTCYRGEYPACGKCSACQERLKGFKEAGFTDLIDYDADISRRG